MLIHPLLIYPPPSAPLVLLVLLVLLVPLVPLAPLPPSASDRYFPKNFLTPLNPLSLSHITSIFRASHNVKSPPRVIYLTLPPVPVLTLHRRPVNSFYCMHTLSFTTFPSRPAPGCDALNLRPRPNGQAEVTPPPAIISLSDWRPLDGLWFASGSRLGLIDPSGSIAAVAVAPSAVTSVRSVTPDTVIVFTAAHGPLTIRRDSSGQWTFPETPAGDFPVQIHASTPATLSASIGPRTLSADYSREARLAPADLDAIRSDLRKAYDTIGAQASALGLLIQPVVARWKLVDASSSAVILSSPPLFLAPPSGFQGTTLIDVDASVTDKGLTRLSSYSLSLEAFSIEVSAPSDDIAAAGLRIAVEVSPAVDPVDFSRPPVYRLNPRVTSGPLLSVALPATDSATLFAASAVAGICDRWDSLAVPWPGSAPEGTSASSAHASLMRRLALPPVASRVPAGLLPPHTFDAAGSCRSGNVVVWYGLRSHRFPGYSPAAFICGGDSEAQAASAAVIVEFADGSRIITQHAVPSGAFWNPLISYPDGSARRIVILISDGGEVRRLALPLTSSPCGRLAFWLHPSALPFSPAAHPDAVSAVWQLPPAINASTPATQMCGCARADQPLSLSDVLSVSSGEVITVTPSPGSGSAWDFATPKFIAFCADGIHTLALSASADGPQFRGARLLDGRAVASPAAVCQAPDGIYALAASHLVKVGRTGVSDILPSLAPSAALGFAAGELWISTPGWLGCRSLSSSSFVRRSLGDDTAPDFTSIVPSPGGGLYALAPDGRIADLTAEADSPVTRYSVPVAFTRDIDVGAVPVAVTLRIKVPALGSVDPDSGLPLASSCALRLLVTAPDIPAAAPILDVAISGIVTAPLFFPVYSPPVTRLRFTLSGTAPAGSLLHSITLKTNPFPPHKL